MIFIINVVIAVAATWSAWEDHGEKWYEWREKKTAKALRRLLLLWLTPILTLALLPLTHRAETKAEKEIGTLKLDTARAILKAEEERNARIKLEKELLDAKMELKNVNPKSQRVATAEASVWVEVDWHSKMPKEFVNAAAKQSRVGELVARFGTNRQDGIILVSRSFSHWQAGDANTGFEMNTFTMSFSREDSVPSPMYWMPSHINAAVIDEIERINLNLSFLFANLPVTTGGVTLVINGNVRKEFVIPNQKPSGIFPEFSRDIFAVPVP